MGECAMMEQLRGQGDVTMLNRREFLGAGAGVAMATLAHALPGDKMRYAMSGHQFRTTPPHPETGIRMTARYGYHGLEPFQEDVAKYLEQPPSELKKLLDGAGLALCTIGSGGQYFDAPALQRTIDSNTARARYIANFGCRHLKVNLSRRVSAENLSAANARILATNLNEVGKRTADEGIKFAFHPHCWTLVERQPELNMIMDLTDPRLVYLVLDTGHATLGGIDPVKCLREYYTRIAAIHLKDTEPKYNTANGWKGPAPSEEEHNRVNLYKRLGSGGVDFPAFFQILRERHYDGWVTLDFDAPRPGEGTVEQDMNRHKKYLLETLHAELKA
jgi:inosose dehydratase